MRVLDRALLWYQYRRMAHAKFIDKIVIATADTPANTPIVEFAQAEGVDFYAGSEADLISRNLEAARRFQGNVIVRIGADCPLTDPRIIDSAIRFYCDRESELDYVNTGSARGFPDGMDVAVMPLSTLERLDREVKKKRWRADAWAYVLRHPQRFRVDGPRCDWDLSDLRLTLDYEEDYQLIGQIIEALYPQKEMFLLEDICRLLDRRPELKRINERWNTRLRPSSTKKEADS